MKNLLRIAFACIALVFAFTAPGARAEATSSPGNVADDANFIQAKRAIETKNWERALYNLKYVKFEDPEVYSLTGYANRKLGRYDEAFRNYKIALQKDPNHRGAHEYVGEAYLLTNNPAMAQEHLAALEKICGKNCEEYKDLAREIAEYKQKH